MDYNVSFDIFERETKNFIRSFFYEKKRRKARWISAVFLIPAVILINSFLVKAGISYYYSPLCLGSWSYVKNVEGEPQLASGTDVLEFNNSNSAVLKNSGGQIFCGRFESTNLPEGNIGDIKLKLSIAVLENKPVEYNTEDIEDGTLLEVDERQDAVFIIETPVIEEEYIEETETPEPTLESTSLPTSSSEPSIESQSIPTPELELTPTPELTPVSAPTSSEPSELNENQPTSFIKGLVHSAHAQELGPENLNLDDLLSVQYTLDGENWNELGKVNGSNWKNLNFKIPVSSLDELSRLQVGIFSLPTLNDAVVIYLDSIWLEIETDSQVIEFIQDIAETIFEAVTFQNLLNSEETVQPALELNEPKLIKIKEYNFDIGGAEKANDELEWYSRENIEKLDKFLSSKKDRGISINTEDESKALTISGLCRDEYYVILLYKNRDDYAKNPSSAVYNSAFECDGKINHRLETENLISGNYYLLIGEQGNTGTWIPVSDLIKISLEITEKIISE